MLHTTLYLFIFSRDGDANLPQDYFERPQIVHWNSTWVSTEILAWEYNRREYFSRWICTWNVRIYLDIFQQINHFISNTCQRIFVFPYLLCENTYIILTYNVLLECHHIGTINGIFESCCSVVTSCFWQTSGNKVYHRKSNIHYKSRC